MKKTTSAVKHLKLALYIAIAIILVLLGVLIGVLVSAGNQTATEKTVDVTPTATPLPAMTAAPEESSYLLIETPHISLRLPKEGSEHILHEHETNGSLTTEVFYMIAGEEQIPLYRVDFGSEETGDWLGMLQTEKGNVPVTYTVFMVTDEELAALGENTAETYMSLMNGFNVLLDGILSDSRFTTEKPLDVGEDKAAALTHWNITLPGNMVWTESNVDGVYEAMFYGMILGERTPLYHVRIGGETLQTELGRYIMEGADHAVSVESFDLPQNPSWTEEDYSAAYRMMDTINDVIQAITSSESFYIPEPSAE